MQTRQGCQCDDRWFYRGQPYCGCTSTTDSTRPWCVVEAGCATAHPGPWGSWDYCGPDRGGSNVNRTDELEAGDGLHSDQRWILEPQASFQAQDGPALNAMCEIDMCKAGLASLGSHCDGTEDAVMLALMADLSNAGCFNNASASTAGSQARRTTVHLTLRQGSNGDLDTNSLHSIVSQLLGVDRSSVEFFHKENDRTYSFDAVSDTLHPSDIVSLLSPIGTATADYPHSGGWTSQVGKATEPETPVDYSDKKRPNMKPPSMYTFFAISISVSALGTMAAMFFYGVVVGRVRKLIRRPPLAIIDDFPQLNDPLDFADDVSWLPDPDPATGVWMNYVSNAAGIGSSESNESDSECSFDGASVPPNDGSGFGMVGTFSEHSATIRDAHHSSQRMDATHRALKSSSREGSPEDLNMVETATTVGDAVISVDELCAEQAIQQMHWQDTTAGTWEHQGDEGEDNKSMIAMAEPVAAVPMQSDSGLDTREDLRDMHAYRAELELELERVKAYTASATREIPGPMQLPQQMIPAQPIQYVPSNAAGHQHSVSVSVTMQQPATDLGVAAASRKRRKAKVVRRPPADVTEPMIQLLSAQQQGVSRQPRPRKRGKEQTLKSKTGDAARTQAIHPCTHPGCGYVASQRRYLKEHLRVHSGDRPYKCTWPGCTYASAGSGHVARHMRTHTGERPYTCPVQGCDYAASQSGHLRTHMLVHSRGHETEGTGGSSE
eukprot:SAG31_NODE_263_length_18841_cov_17.270996_9_plen_721_part_00